MTEFLGCRLLSHEADLFRLTAERRGQDVCYAIRELVNREIRDTLAAGALASQG